MRRPTPAQLLERVRAVASVLPDVVEVTLPAEASAKFDIRRHTFALVLTRDDDRTILVFRADPEEQAALRATGRPFFDPQNHDRVGMVLDGATDWIEVAELVTASYCRKAPKKLAALVERPPPIA